MPVSAPAPVAIVSDSGKTAYSDDFEGGAKLAWINGRTNDFYHAAFTEFLGRYGNQTVSLTLVDLPPHDSVWLEFDLYLIDSWDGGDLDYGPDIFEVGYGGSRSNLLSNTFGECFAPGDNLASEPEGSCDRDLGFNPGFIDSIYRNLNDGSSFGHNGSELVINFSGRNLQGLDDESWGIDNVRVTVFTAGLVTSPPPAVLPVVTEPSDGSLISEDFSSPVLDDWAPLGSASHDPDSGVIVLTEPVGDQLGYVFHRHPVNAERFKVGFSFEIGGGNGADGLALVISRFVPTEADLRAAQGDDGGPFGWNAMEGFGIEFDTWGGNDGDPADNHVGVTVFPEYRALVANVIEPTLRNSGIFDATIVFDYGHVQVYLANANIGLQPTLVLDYVIEGFVPFDGYIGFVGATGGSNDRHIIHSVTFDGRAGSIPPGAVASNVPEPERDVFFQCVAGLLGMERMMELGATGSHPTDEEIEVIMENCGEPPIDIAELPTVVYEVAAYIDGRSRLMIRGDFVQWLHLEAAAPGRYNLTGEATFINGFEWVPAWPDEPDRENRDCGCYSSELEGRFSRLPEGDVVAWVAGSSARGSVYVLEQPSEDNDYTLVVEFDDLGHTDADWYEVTIEVRGGTSLPRAGSGGMTRGATISGRVTDADTGFPLSHVRVRADSTGYDDNVDDVDTDDDGRYTLRGLRPGSYVIMAEQEQRGYIRTL